MHAICCFTVLLSLTCSDASAAPAAPLPRPELQENVVQWSFEKGPGGWTGYKNALVTATDGFLAVRGTEGPPSIHRRVEFLGGELEVRLTARTSQAGTCRIGWMTAESPRIDDEKSQSFTLVADGQWHDYTARLHAPGHLISLYLEFSAPRGKIDFQSIDVIRHRRHPLGVDRVERTADAVRFHVSNTGMETVAYQADDSGSLARGETKVFAVPIRRDRTLETVVLRIKTPGLPDVVCPVFVYHDDRPLDGVTRRLGAYEVDVARDGRMARVCKDGEPVALLAPIVHIDGRIPEFEMHEDGAAIILEAEDVDVRLEFRANGGAGGQLEVDIDSRRPCEGPVVRVVGRLEGGLLPGLEFLGPDEPSSSAIDVETDARVRYLPKPIDVTMPLMSVVSRRVGVGLAWDDTALQPVFATPNVFDAAGDHRLALRGQTIDATIRLGEEPLEEVILWAIRRRGLPAPPPAPRESAEQERLSLAALEHALRSDEGWGQAAERSWPRRPYADLASTQWRLTGQAPAVADLEPGGSLLPNEAIYFVTDRVYPWRMQKTLRIGRIRDLQRDDGSFAYSGRLAESLDVPHLRAAGLPTDTTSGFCARYAVSLWEYARQTGDAVAVQSARATCDYMTRFRVPRGGMYWDVPIHCPDLLAAGHLVWAYVRGYEMTGRQAYLDEARRWALCGMPFVYQWGDRPVMLYATPPAFGATDRRNPEWFGTPAPWIGVVYAYSLTLLARHDETLDWEQAAVGILHAAEQMQYTDGPYAGCLPDQFDLDSQRGKSWHLNPAGLVSLRAAIEGRAAGLVVVSDSKHRVTGPFPMTIDGRELRVIATPGVVYQLLLDGGRIVDVRSEGEDVLQLESQ